MACRASSKTFIMAIIDTGIDFAHPNLEKKIYQIKNFPHGIDLSFGAKKQTDPIDLDGHGTHMAGIISQETKDQVEIKILPLKYFSARATPQENMNSLMQALELAITQKVHLILYTSAGESYSLREEELFKKALKNNIFIVTSSGNQQRNIDHEKYYPCSYQLKNIICVGAYDEKKRRWEKSNYGKKTVTLFAPGENISSTLPFSSFGLLSGTSQAAAYVAARIARLFYQLKKWGVNERKLIIKTLLSSPQLLREEDLQ